MNIKDQSQRVWYGSMIILLAVMLAFLGSPRNTWADGSLETIYRKLVNENDLNNALSYSDIADSQLSGLSKCAAAVIACQQGVVGADQYISKALLVLDKDRLRKMPKEAFQKVYYCAGRMFYKDNNIVKAVYYLSKAGTREAAEEIENIKKNYKKTINGLICQRNFDSVRETISAYKDLFVDGNLNSQNELQRVNALEAALGRIEGSIQNAADVIGRKDYQTGNEFLGTVDRDIETIEEIASCVDVSDWTRKATCQRDRARGSLSFDGDNWSVAATMLSLAMNCRSVEDNTKLRKAEARRDYLSLVKKWMSMEMPNLGENEQFSKQIDLLTTTQKELFTVIKTLLEIPSQISTWEQIGELQNKRITIREGKRNIKIKPYKRFVLQLSFPFTKKQLDDYEAAMTAYKAGDQFFSLQDYSKAMGSFNTALDKLVTDSRVHALHNIVADSSQNAEDRLVGKYVEGFQNARTKVLDHLDTGELDLAFTVAQEALSQFGAIQPNSVRENSRVSGYKRIFTQLKGLCNSLFQIRADNQVDGANYQTLQQTQEILQVLSDNIDQLNLRGRASFLRVMEDELSSFIGSKAKLVQTEEDLKWISVIYRHLIELKPSLIQSAEEEKQEFEVWRKLNSLYSTLANARNFVRNNQSTYAIVRYQKILNWHFDKSICPFDFKSAAKREIGILPEFAVLQEANKLFHKRYYILSFEKYRKIIRNMDLLRKYTLGSIGIGSESGMATDSESTNLCKNVIVGLPNSAEILLTARLMAFIDYALANNGNNSVHVNRLRKAVQEGLGLWANIEEAERHKVIWHVQNYRIDYHWLMARYYKKIAVDMREKGDTQNADINSKLSVGYYLWGFGYTKNENVSDLKKKERIKNKQKILIMELQQYDSMFISKVLKEEIEKEQNFPNSLYVNKMMKTILVTSIAAIGGGSRKTYEDMTKDQVQKTIKDNYKNETTNSSESGIHYGEKELREGEVMVSEKRYKEAYEYFSKASLDSISEQHRDKWRWRIALTEILHNLEQDVISKGNNCKGPTKFIEKEFFTGEISLKRLSKVVGEKKLHKNYLKFIGYIAFGDCRKERKDWINAADNYNYWARKFAKPGKEIQLIEDRLSALQNAKVQNSHILAQRLKTDNLDLRMDDVMEYVGQDTNLRQLQNDYTKNNTTPELSVNAQLKTQETENIEQDDGVSQKGKNKKDYRQVLSVKKPESKTDPKVGVQIRSIQGMSKEIITKIWTDDLTKALDRIESNDKNVRVITQAVIDLINRLEDNETINFIAGEFWRSEFIAKYREQKGFEVEQYTTVFNEFTDWYNGFQSKKLRHNENDNKEHTEAFNKFMGKTKEAVKDDFVSQETDRKGKKKDEHTIWRPENDR